MGDFFDKAKKVAGIAAEKTGDVVEMGKQKAKIMSLKSDVGDAEKKIGRLFYEKLRSDESVEGEIADLIREITDKEAQIEELEDSIQKIKEEGR
jgi:predicted  nucleic acid-binding Zn-ribbon protein